MVVLPAPLGPEQAEHLAARDVEVDARAPPRERRRPCVRPVTSIAGTPLVIAPIMATSLRRVHALRLHRHRDEHHARAGRRARADGRLTEVLQRRAFTRLGRGLAPGGDDPGGADRRDRERRRRAGALAEQAGAQSHPRGRHGGDPRRRQPRRVLRARCATHGGVEVCVLDGEEEARLAFLGRHADARASRSTAASAVVDVGGGSTEIAVGTLDGGVEWWASFPFGSGFLADAYLGDDPPSPARARRGPLATPPRCSPASRRRRSTSRWRSAAARPRCGASSAPSSTPQSLERALRALDRESGGGRRGAVRRSTPSGCG